jgi:hypothetical protein
MTILPFSTSLCQQQWLELNPWSWNDGVRVLPMCYFCWTLLEPLTFGWWGECSATGHYLNPWPWDDEAMDNHCATTGGHTWTLDIGILRQGITTVLLLEDITCTLDLGIMSQGITTVLLLVDITWTIDLRIMSSVFFQCATPTSHHLNPQSFDGEVRILPLCYGWWIILEPLNLGSPLCYYWWTLLEPLTLGF